ncbi:coproporphyrinogen III oxidase, partial [Campylobacter jejuni]|nr:coproporphyrinogen III oxidase [Campylobacter jejuni]
KSIEKEFCIDFQEYFKEDLKALEEYKDFINFDENFIKVNETGVLLIRNIAMCFDAYMKNISEDKKYSQKRCKNEI